MKTHRRTFVLLPAALAVVCASRAAHAAPPPSGIPCSARADAVIANSGAIFSDSRSLVDSYQSSAGAYGGANVGAEGNVEAATTVVANGGVIHGTETQQAPAGLAVVPVPAGATNLGNLNINDAAQNITLAPGSYVAANVNVNFPGTITISPPGPVLIWVTGNLNLGGTENLNGVPDNLEFLVNSPGSVNVNSGGNLFGFIYAPTSAVDVNSTIFGGVVGSTVSLNSGSAVHFDQNSICEVLQVSAGANSACALTSDGGVECWGDNSFGELGNNSTIGSPVPVQVTGLTMGVAAVSVGGSGACALTTSGGVVCWGAAISGIPAIGSLVPVQVPGLTSGVTAVSVGLQSACALTASGGVMCWGDNDFGELGNNETAFGPIPSQVTGLAAGATAVSVGAVSACAATTSGVLCWGNNATGRLGDNSTISSSVPVQVSGLTSGVTAVSVGDSACAVTSSGAVMCWGDNTEGELGTLTPGNLSLVPIQATGLASGAVSVSVKFQTACALMAGGGVMCWGLDPFGGLGEGTIPSFFCEGNPQTPCSPIPVQVTGFTSGASEVSVGGSDTSGFACALTAEGGVACWGDNQLGELGNNGVSPNTCVLGTACSLVPVSVVGLP